MRRARTRGGDTRGAEAREGIGIKVCTDPAAAECDVCSTSSLQSHCIPMYVYTYTQVQHRNKYKWSCIDYFCAISYIACEWGGYCRVMLRGSVEIDHTV